MIHTPKTDDTLEGPMTPREPWTAPRLHPLGATPAAADTPAAAATAVSAESALSTVLQS
jgi:hypothetical protein